LSIPIKFDIDTTTAETKVAGLIGTVDKVENKTEKIWNNVKTNYTYYNQLASIALSNLAKAAEGTAALGYIQAAQVAQTAIVGQIGAIQIGLQAAAAFATPGMQMQGLILTSIATALQMTVLSATAAQIQSSLAEKQAEDIRRQIEAYTI